MSNTFFISDTHFGHQGICEFTHWDGSPLRPFDTWQENDMAIVENWNRVVGRYDNVYHLGDYAFSALGHRMVKLLNGNVTLIRGNHDQKPAAFYLDMGFKDVLGVKQVNGFWLTHVPMHEQCVNEERVKANIHGHLHRNLIENSKYVNVSVEQINYTPISFDEIKEKVNG